MRLHTFIELRQEEILREWDAFATSLHAATARMTRVAIRDHAREMLEAVAADLAVEQSADEQHEKSIGNAPVSRNAPRTAAQTHALLRAKSGFDINELVAEYRALRASVLRLWAAEIAPEAIDVQDTIRFNEAIDQALAESVTFFTTELERSRNLLLGMLGHDMRNPLNVVVMTAKYLQKLDVGDVVSRAAARLLSSGARLQALLDDLVDYNRSNLGVGIRITRRPCDLTEVFNEQLDLLRAAHPEQEVEFQCSGDLNGTWDADRLHQLLGNLVTNALKYGDQTRPVCVRVEGRDQEVRIEVSNEGKPIAPNSIADIFKPLRRGTAPHHDPHANDSLGLGLYIVSEVANAHGGQVSVTSDEGATVFLVLLRRASA